MVYTNQLDRLVTVKKFFDEHPNEWFNVYKVWETAMPYLQHKQMVSPLLNCLVELNILEKRTNQVIKEYKLK